jgi:hypothetical protein
MTLLSEKDDRSQWGSQGKNWIVTSARRQKFVAEIRLRSQAAGYLVEVKDARPTANFTIFLFPNESLY